MKKTMGITVFGCGKDEAEMFERLSPDYGIMPTIVNDAVSVFNAKLATGNRCVSVEHKSVISKSILLALKNAGVKYISTRSIGCNHIDTTAAERMGISVDTMSYSADSVADYTLMLMAIRGMKSTLYAVETQDFRLESTRGKELREMTVGVLGTGRIGSAVISRLRGFGCNVLAYDHCQKAGVHYVSFEELLRDSDIITLHIPLDSNTHHIIGPKQIKQMKDGALLINMARGALIDTGAMTEALESGKLGGAAMDVLEGEEGIFYADFTRKTIKHPFLPRLLSMPNVMITPHTAYHTERVLRDTVENTIKNCLNFVKEAQA